MKVDQELINGCQRYLKTLKERLAIVEQQEAELRRADEQRDAKREKWRKKLYESNEKGLFLILPEGSRLNEE